MPLVLNPGTSGNVTTWPPRLVTNSAPAASVER